MCVAFPSFAIYSVDEIVDPAVTIKAVGHQWYWSYEYSDYVNEDGEFINFDSYMISEDDLLANSKDAGKFRLLEVDNRVVLHKLISGNYNCGRRNPLLGYPITWS